MYIQFISKVNAARDYARIVDMTWSNRVTVEGFSILRHLK